MHDADVRTPAEVEALAARILEPRDRPLVLVSADAGGRYLFDLDHLRRELDGIAEIVTVETGPASHALEHLLPPKSQALGGAARSYPGDFGSNPDWTRSHLRFPDRADTDDLIDDVLAQHRPADQDAAGRSAGAAVPASDPRSSESEDPATRQDLDVLKNEVAAMRADLHALTKLVARGIPVVPDADDLDLLRTEIERLSAELTDERDARAKAEALLADATQDRRDAGEALRDARRAAERAHVDATEDGIRIEIERTWGNRTSPGERQRWPLREFEFGPAFIDSLDALDENQLSKAVRACVDAITGRDREIPARELHRLRSGEGGDDTYVVRTDGARCWRSSIEQNAPGARRLHYWELADGVIELSRVVPHDDTRP